MEVNKPNKVQRHVAQSTQYFDNAIRAIEAGEPEKASEFLWGSLSQALKAVGASRGILLNSHDQIKRYALDIAKDLSDEGIWYAFIEAQSLHSNFYETGLQIEDVRLGADHVKRAIAKVFSLISDGNK